MTAPRPQVGIVCNKEVRNRYIVEADLELGFLKKW